VEKQMRKKMFPSQLSFKRREVADDSEGKLVQGGE
jgi:hypothetical protein